MGWASKCRKINRTQTAAASYAQPFTALYRRISGGYEE